MAPRDRHASDADSSNADTDSEASVESERPRRNAVRKRKSVVRFVEEMPAAASNKRVKNTKISRYFSACYIAHAPRTAGED